MADTFPSRYVDQKTGKIDTFQTAWSKFTDEAVPNAGHWAMLAGKAALFAPLLGGLAVALPVAGGVFLATRYVMKKSLNALHDRDEREGGGYMEYDFSNSDDRAIFKKLYGRAHPDFTDDLMRMAKMAELKELPKVRVMRPGQGQEDYNCSATTRPDGTAPVVTLGRRAMAELNPVEMRAVVAHELTHVKLGHIQSGTEWLSRGTLDLVMNVALVGVALFAGAPVLPVLALVGVTNVVGRCLKSIQSRRHEELCDKGAALMTGETKALSSALKKVHAGLIRMAQLETNIKYAKKGEPPPEVREAGGIGQFLFASHPSNARRSKLLNAFEQAHKSYCEGKRAEFRTAFNAAAAPPSPKPPKPPVHAPAALHQLRHKAA